MTKRCANYQTITLSFFLPLLLIACQASGGGPAANDGASFDSEAAVVEPADLELVLGSGTFFLPDPHVGLADLASYKAELTVSFDGTMAGQAQQSVSSYVFARSQEPLTKLLSMNNSGDLSPADPAFLGEADGSTFEVGLDGTCRVDLIDPEDSLIDLLEPASFLSALLGADEAGQETVAGVTANHYTFDERALGFDGLAQSTGEIWVAADGGYILKYVLTITGDETYFGEGNQGSMTWDYALTDIDLPPAMELHPACVEILVNAPRLPDATNVLNLAGWLAYDTSSNVAEAAAFYQDQLPDLGWSPALEPTIIEASAYLQYVQGEQVMDIIISTGEASTRVELLLSTTGE